MSGFFPTRSQAEAAGQSVAAEHPDHEISVTRERSRAYERTEPASPISLRVIIACALAASIIAILRFSGFFAAAPGALFVLLLLGLIFLGAAIFSAVPQKNLERSADIAHRVTVENPSEAAAEALESQPGIIEVQDHFVPQASEIPERI